MPFAVDGPGIYEMAVDSTHLYWVESGNFDHVANVRRMPLDGGAIETLLSLPASIYALDVADGFVYVTHTTGGPDYEGHIYRIPVTGGEATSIATGFNPTSVSVDDCWVYFSEASGPDNGRIMRVQTTGGTPQVVVDNLDNPWDLVAKDGVLFYSEMNKGRMMRVVPGHAPTELASGWIGTNWMAVDASFVYFTVCYVGACPFADLMRVPRDGGVPENMQVSASNNAKLAVTGDNIVWGSLLIPKTGGPAQTMPGDGVLIPVTASATHAYFGDWPSGKIYIAPL